ncbi:FAS1-like dehydratase domain-containing protein [Azospirillum endophyticum]
MNFDSLRDWIGREEEQMDIATAAPLSGLAATLDHLDPPWRGGEVPPLGHWLYFLPKAAQRTIDQDGHPRRGGFLPPVPLPRRMFAGVGLQCFAPIRPGDAMRRRSTIASVEHKAGRTGGMVFVTVEHDIFTQSGHVLRETQDIVYREAAKPGDAPPPAHTEPAPIAVWQRPVTPDPVLLFRFSALTFNGHRIHYDRPYCETVEGYPGLVVHGPLIATLLMDLFLRENPGARVTAFRFRARRPLYDVHPFMVCGAPSEKGASLWACGHDGRIAMSAELEAV